MLLPETDAQYEDGWWWGGGAECWLKPLGGQYWITAELLTVSNHAAAATVNRGCG